MDIYSGAGESIYQSLAEAMGWLLQWLKAKADGNALSSVGYQKFEGVWAGHQVLQLLSLLHHALLRRRVACIVILHAFTVHASPFYVQTLHAMCCLMTLHAKHHIASVWVIADHAADYTSFWIESFSNSQFKEGWCESPLSVVCMLRHWLS